MLLLVFWGTYAAFDYIFPDSVLLWTYALTFGAVGLFVVKTWPREAATHVFGRATGRRLRRLMREEPSSPAVNSRPKF